MSTHNDMPAELLALFDQYIGGTLDQAALELLETRLRHDPSARSQFVCYCQMHTDLGLEARARHAGSRALDALGRSSESVPHLPSASGPVFLRIWRYVFAATILLAISTWALLSRGGIGHSQEPEGVAWLVNAQDCRWSDNQAPDGNMRPGKVLRLLNGLAEIRFQVGAQVVLQGPAALELLSGNSARLIHGKLAATVPPSARGFEILSPHGRVVDLGTEFGLSVGDDGWTDVYVFTGKVEAFAGDAQLKSSAAFSITEKQSARIDAAGVAFKPADNQVDGKDFVRAIEPKPRLLPRIFAVDFRNPVPGTIADCNGSGTGLTQRLRGTGKELLLHDENLLLHPDKGMLALTTTKTDINTSYKLEVGEYLGVKLADLGFTGVEDFEVTVLVPEIPELAKVGQFGLYAGMHSKRSIRGGMISSSKEPGTYKYILVQNQNGKDMKPHFVGMGYPGNDIRLTLRRKGGEYSLTAENLKTSGSTTIAMPGPEFLEGPNLYAGFFGANTQSEERRTLMLKDFKVTVWTVAPPQ